MPKHAKRASWRTYATFVRGLADNSESCKAIAQRHGVDVTHTRRILRLLHDNGIVGICGWEASGLRKNVAPVYCYPPTTDVPRPLTKSGQPSKHKYAMLERAKPRLEVTTFVAMMRALAEPIEGVEFAHVCGIHYNSSLRFVKHALAIGLIHIAGWVQRLDGGAPSRLLAIGIGLPNAPRPKRQSKRDLHRAYMRDRAERLVQLRTLAALAGRGTVVHQQAGRAA
jgi:hypothetical protein